MRGILAAAALAVALGAVQVAVRGQDGGPELPRADEALGRVLDREGVAAVRSRRDRAGPGGRWRGLATDLLLEAGDLVEVGTRGANAARLELSSGVELTLGPGALCELEGPLAVVLHRGELSCRAPEGVELRVSPPEAASGEQVALTLTGRAVVRGRAASTRSGAASIELLDEDPRWLVGYESDQVTDAVGTLLANVDGRDVPLTIGYHEVTVDVRDQLARTVVEQSFVNHTNQRLEGVFYFPLPADASISGFGMWVGGELVQGDIVEKQRAREIYETILREKRDPGLLEWTGGNLFKARVFPIDGEKRIRISYTQVLPREGDGFRYRYALESEHLRQHPLGRLGISVTVHSARPLASVASTTHAGSLELDREPSDPAGAHSARYEFTAEEYTPEGDFELAVGLAPDARGLSLVTHRRGDDGYFMLLIDPPAELERDERSRGVGEPLELLILADTSGSMWGPQRAAQVAFVEALLQALGDGDRFDLATCDVETRWAFGALAEPSDERREAALAFLEAREPLGWSDLEAAVDAALARAGASTQVVYVGDALPTSGAADPVALGRALAERHRARGGSGSFHVVVPGSSSEPLLARALAGLGGGSLRQIGAGADALETAHALLAELTAPTLRELDVSFRGLPVAAVHPEQLANLPAGSQQVLVGRYDATQGDLAGSVVVRGTVDGRPVERELAVAIEAEDEGNSFVPRLWARRHLDHLLEQGSDPAVVERIQRLSADYQIVTPYTSLLVLESEEDRERFGVPKSFRMRDGEEFFLEGREAARHDLTRAALQATQGWKRRLRLEALARIGEMGRGLTQLLEPAHPIDYGTLGVAYLEVGAGGAFGGDVRGVYRGPSDSVAAGFARNELAQSDESSFEDGSERADPLRELGYTARGAESEQLVADLPFPAPFPAEEPSIEGRDDFYLGQSAKRVAGPSSPGAGGKLGVRFGGRAPTGWTPRPYWSQLFPQVPEPVESLESDWPNDVRALLEGLDRRTSLPDGGLRVSLRQWSAQLEGGVVPRAPRADDLIGQSELVQGEAGWWTSGPRFGTHAFSTQWFETVDSGGTRGILTEGWRLASERPARPGDERPPALGLRWYLDDTLRQMARYSARLEPAEAGRVRVHLWLPATPSQELALELDAATGALLEERWLQDGEVLQTWRYLGQIDVAGRPWPTRIEHSSKDAARANVTDVTVEAPGAAAIEARLAAEREARTDALILSPLPVLHEAKRRAAATGGGAPEDLAARLVLLQRALERSDRPATAAHLAALEAAFGQRIGLERIRLFALQQVRQREDLRLRGLELVRGLAANPRPGELGMANDLMGSLGGFGAHEGLELLRALLPVIERAEASWSGSARATWDRAFLRALERTGRTAEYRVAVRLAAERHPNEIDLQSLQAQSLASSGEVEAAVAWLDAVLAREGAEGSGALDPWSVRNLCREVLDLYWQARRPEELVRRFERWDAADHGKDQDFRLDAEACGRYLAALTVLDRLDEALARADAWFAFAEHEELEPGGRERLQAAVRFLLGQTRDLNGGALDLGRRGRLAGIARELAEREDPFGLLGTVLGDWRFRQTDEARAVLLELFADLQRNQAELSAPYVLSLIGVLYRWNDELAPEAAWHALAARLFERWRASEDEAERVPLGQALLAIAPWELRLEFRRADLAAAERREDRHARAEMLFGELTSGDWSAERQAELFALLVVLDASAASERERDGLAARLTQLVDWALARDTERRVQAQEGLDGLTRRELATARREARAESGAALSAALAELARSHPVEWLRDWIVLERLWLDFTDRRAGPDGGRRALALGEAHAAALTAPVLETAERPDDLRERVLATRALTTAARALLGPGQDDAPALELDLLAVLARLGAAGVGLPDGRGLERDLLLALDRADELEQRLAAWYGAGDDYATLRFGIDLAVLRAERGELAAAAELLEAVERFDEVSPQLLLLLADWRTALDQREAAQAARLRAFEALEEDALAQSLGAGRGRAPEGAPQELDPDVPLKLVALMRKASYPGNYLWTVRELYLPTKDFRLLEALPYGVIGHSAQGIYNFLGSLEDLVQGIDEEAVVDRVERGLMSLEAGELSAVDRRALALLRFQVVYLAARQGHGVERHVERSLAALRAALPADAAGALELAEGEAPLYAEFLMQRGRLEPDVLAEEALRQLRVLAAAASTGDPDEGLAVSSALAAALWNHGRRDDALRVLEAALDARREAAGGALPPQAHQALGRLSEWLIESGSFPRAEALWAAEAARAPTEALRLALELGRLRVLEASVRSRPVREGAYERARDQLLLALEPRTNEEHARDVIDVLCAVFRDAGEAGLARDDARRFAFGVLPGVLGRYQYREGQRSVERVAGVLEHLGGPTLALEFLVVRAESEPRWLRFVNQDAWAQHSWQLARWRQRAGGLERVEAGGSGLAERLLALSLSEVRRDLRLQDARGRALYDHRHSEFWSARRGDFLAAAMEVAVGIHDAPRALAHAAEYLFEGLDARDEALGLLGAAHGRGALDEAGRRLLARYLQDDRRWQASVPVLEGLLEQDPADAGLWRMLMLAHHALEQRAALAATLERAEAALRAEEAWDEGRIAVLAGTAEECALPDEALRLVDLAIGMRKRSNAGASGDGTLSDYYQTKARVLIVLGRTREAVDAAAGAILAWGNARHARQDALAVLDRALLESPDLEGFAQGFEAEVEASGLENPIVRKALARAFAQRGDQARAARELEQVLALEPNDGEAHELLVRAYRELGREDELARSLLERARSGGHAYSLYTELGEHLERSDPAAAERAFTSLAELSPNESEGHAALAGVRERQGDFAAALVQWDHVVRVRTGEPAGYVGRARALVGLGRADEAREVLGFVRGRTWPEAFQDALREAERLERALR